MRILRRYLIKQLAAPFFFALGASTGFLLLQQIAKRLGELVGKGLPWTVLVEFFILTIPFLVAMTISMAVLMAVCNGPLRYMRPSCKRFNKRQLDVKKNGKDDDNFGPIG